MTQEQWARLKVVFEGALQQAPEARPAWLAGACAGDEALLHEAEALLRTHDTAGDFLEEPARVDPADLETLPPGTVLGAYSVVDEIGRGGMGIVYLADDSRLGRKVALKALPSVVSANPELRERLRREARAAATIAHPAVATVYALEEVDGHLLIVSEYVHGDTLRAVIAQGPMHAARVHAVATQIAGGLAAAHEAGVIHRDLKPENVLITARGDVKLVDFGIAHVEGQEGARLTRAGAVLGTPAYMAPEQLLGAAVDARADLYAFGVLVGEMLTGRHPLAMREAQPTPADTGDETGDDTAAGLAAIARRCMQPDPAARHPSARALLAALDDVGRGGSAAGLVPRRDSGETRAPDFESGVRRDGGEATDSGALAAPGVVPVPRSGRGESDSRWWWEFHQAMAALVYWLMTIPAWQARGLIGGTWGRALFIATLVAVVVAANLRLHLWFTSRFYPAQLRWVRRRTGRWIQGADWVFVAMLAAGGLLVGDRSSPLAVLLLAVGVGTALAFLVIEPVTARAAFKTGGGKELID